MDHKVDTRWLQLQLPSRRRLLTMVGALARLRIVTARAEHTRREGRHCR